MLGSPAAGLAGIPFSEALPILLQDPPGGTADLAAGSSTLHLAEYVPYGRRSVAGYPKSCVSHHVMCGCALFVAALSFHCTARRMLSVYLFYG